MNTVGKYGWITALGWIGGLWAIGGFLIVVASNIILISGHPRRYWFLPIDPRDNLVTGFLLLAPAALLIIHWYLRKRFHN